MNEILENIENVLCQVADLKYINENWGQLNFYGSEVPVQWPCALIRHTTAQYSNIGKDRQAKPVNRQEGILNIEITVAYLKLTNTSKRAPALQKKQGFRIWETVEKVHEVLQGFSAAANLGGLVRTNTNNVLRDDGVQEVRITYTAGAHDC
ncbi:hypothetical protein [Chryseobacterium sp. MFBS3-17]|uniref:hypothetical protein n=1 Tax=Chryseobacterium sp. MFBS3-17 TaxID=2886689 RepID=UPI001D0E61BF|nr:hypothetical protein [Chryseobacterium sp. MFBS3-17]MCC2590345.1 hypothetical protein [Chryseobacterium sp. MFBS3-17]